MELLLDEEWVGLIVLGRGGLWLGNNMSQCRLELIALS